MRTNYIVEFIIVLFLFASCVSDRTRIEKSSTMIINAIHDSDFKAFSDQMRAADFKKNEENHIFYFNEAHYFMKRYFHDGKPISFQIEKEDALHITKVIVPLFKGYDSSNGAKRAILILSFRPSTPYSRYSNLMDFNVDEDLDVEYRQKFLVKDTGISKPNLDSEAIKKMNEIPLFN